MGRGAQGGARVNPAEMPPAGLSTKALMNNSLKIHGIDNFNRPEPSAPRGTNQIGPVPRTPAPGRPAGLPTSQVAMFNMRSRIVDPDRNYEHGPIGSSGVPPERAQTPTRLQTADVIGARPQSRPGYGMGHYTLGNGMLGSYRTTRETNPLQPRYTLPRHEPDAFIPVSHSTYQYAPATARQGSTMSCSDITGAATPHRKPRTASYSATDYSDVNGPRFYSPRFRQRVNTSLVNEDIEGSTPNCRQHLPGIQKKSYTTPGQGTLYAEDIQGTKPAGGVGYNVGRFPVPRRPQWVFSTLPRREALSRPNCGSHYADRGVYPNNRFAGPKSQTV